MFLSFFLISSFFVKLDAVCDVGVELGDLQIKARGLSAIYFHAFFLFVFKLYLVQHRNRFTHENQSEASWDNFVRATVSTLPEFTADLRQTKTKGPLIIQINLSGGLVSEMLRYVYQWREQNIDMATLRAMIHLYNYIWISILQQPY